MAIYAFYKRRRNHLQLTSSANRGRYLRLMVISSTEVLGTIPVGTYYIVTIAKMGVAPWKGWARMHSHRSEVIQVAGFIWKNNPVLSFELELLRWSLVACAFLFFALFGITGEAREHYYRLYKSLARRIGKSTSTPHGAPLACVVRLPCWSVLIHLGLRHSFSCSTPSVPYVKRNDGATNPIMVQMGRNNDNLSISFTDQSSTVSISMESTLIQDSMTLKDSDSDSDIVSFYTAKSSNEPGMEHQYQLAPPPGLLPTLRPVSVPSAPPPVYLPTVRPASVPSAPPPGILPTLHPASVLPHFPEPTKSTMPVYASSSVETV
jgi:hypothetical protein